MEGLTLITLAKFAVFVLSSSLAAMPAVVGQVPEKTPELYFSSSPAKQLFSSGENVVINLDFWSRSEQPLYVSRLQNGAFVTFKVTGPDGREVPWHNGQPDPKQYSPSDFAVLKQYTGIRANRIISLRDGEGFSFEEPGQYSLTTEFSMDPSDRFAAAAGDALPPVGSFQSKAAFCIEACISEPLPVRNNAPQSALAAIRAFYNIIIKYQQLGIPYGRESKTLRPLLSKRIAYLLDSLNACDADYYRRYGETLRANTYKPATPWLEEGLFTGPNEAATPGIFKILGSKSIGDTRIDVELEFTTKQTYSPSIRMQPSYDHYRGVVTAILENHRWVIDDYVAMYGNDNLQRLSTGYPQCKEGLWVDEKSH